MDDTVLNNHRQAFQACQTRAAASLTRLTRLFTEAHAVVNDLNHRDKKIADREKELESSKTDLDSLKSLMKINIKDLDSVTESLKRKRDESDSTEQRFTDSAAKLKCVEKRLESKSRELREVEAAVKSQREEVKVNEKQLCLMQKSMAECSNTLESRNVMVKKLELRVKEWCCKLGLKERCSYRSYNLCHQALVHEPAAETETEVIHSLLKELSLL